MNQIFTEIIAKIKDIPLYEAILFLLYFSFSLQFNLFGIKYIITIINANHLFIWNHNEQHTISFI